MTTTDENCEAIALLGKYPKWVREYIKFTCPDTEPPRYNLEKVRTALQEMYPAGDGPIYEAEVFKAGWTAGREWYCQQIEENLPNVS
jgi:hypothetical protein